MGNQSLDSDRNDLAFDRINICHCNRKFTGEQKANINTFLYFLFLVGGYVDVKGGMPNFYTEDQGKIVCFENERGKF